MKPIRIGLVFGLGLLGVSAQAKGKHPVDCSQFNIDPLASQALHSRSLRFFFGACHTRMSNSFAIPDPNCTPGAFNPTITPALLSNPSFRTSCVRQHTTTAKEKAATYRWYSIPHPSNNAGATQSCELDHLVPLELGGADTLDNIWPQCGPPGISLNERYFKQKDMVENYLAWMVRRGQMDLTVARKGIASDWTQYLGAAKQHCTARGCQ